MAHSEPKEYNMRTCSIQMEGNTEFVWFNTSKWNLDCKYEEELYMVTVEEGAALTLITYPGVHATPEMHAAYWMERIRMEEQMDDGNGPHLTVAEHASWSDRLEDEWEAHLEEISYQ
jgi:hypothetical protein